MHRTDNLLSHLIIMFGTIVYKSTYSLLSMAGGVKYGMKNILAYMKNLGLNFLGIGSVCLVYILVVFPRAGSGFPSNGVPPPGRKLPLQLWQRLRSCLSGYGLTTAPLSSLALYCLRKGQHSIIAPLNESISDLKLNHVGIV